MVTVIRIGLVISRNGGVIKSLIPVFKAGFGGTLGSGQQMMSFIHIDDLVRAIEFIIREEVDGIVNLTSPGPVSNKEFTRILGKIVKRPVFLKIPVFMLKLVFGKGAEIIISGQKVNPGVLIKKGFTFRYPDIKSTLKSIIESA